MKLRVKVNVNQWAWGDGDESHVLSGGTHSLPSGEVSLSRDFLQALAAAAAADPGSIEILSADEDAKKAMGGAVESDAQSLKALAKAQEDGSWQEGNLEALIASQEQLAAYAKEEDLDDLAARAEASKAQAEEALAALRGEA